MWEDSTSRATINAALASDRFLDEIAGEGVPECEGLNRVKLLQKGSPEVNLMKQASYVPGAERHVGDYWFRGREPAFVSGETGFEFIPLDVQHSWDEWPADGSGAVIHHPAKPLGMRGDYLDGNEVIYTRHLLLGLDGDLNDVWVYAIKKTALTPLDRELVQALNRLYATRSDGNRVPLPLYGAVVRAGRNYRENAQNDWWVPSFRTVSAYPAKPDLELMQAARYVRRTLPRIGPSIFEQQKGLALVGADRVAVLPPAAQTAALPQPQQELPQRAQPEMRMRHHEPPPPPEDEPEEGGVGPRPFPPLDLNDDPGV